MKLTRGVIVAGESTEEGKKFTVSTGRNAEVKLNEAVVCLSDYRLEEGSIWELVRYLEDRPALITDKEVRAGVNAIRMFMEHTLA